MRRLRSACPLLVLLGLALPTGRATAQATTPPTPATPTEPTRVTLGFKAEPASRAIRALAERSGGLVDTFNANDARLEAASVTLEGPGPVPFWEAVDRLSAAAGLRRWITPAGPLGLPRPKVQFQAPFGYGLSAATAAAGPSSEEGPAEYVGAFRIGPVAVDERVSLRFRGEGGPAEAVGKAGETRSFSAEIPILAEPALLAIPLGPLARVEAIDDLGQSLLDPTLGGTLPPPALSSVAGGVPTMIRLPLVRGAKPGRSLAKLAGFAPMEVARRPARPTAEFPLAVAAGTTFRDGEIRLTVRERPEGAEGPGRIGLTIGLEGPRGDFDPARPGLLDARLWSIYFHQVELADARGVPTPVRGVNAVVRAIDAGRRELAADLTYAPGPTGPAMVQAGSPTTLRVYRAAWVAWELPLAFRDVPLP